MQLQIPLLRFGMTNKKAGNGNGKCNGDGNGNCHCDGREETSLLEAHVLAVVLVVPVGYLLKGLSEGVDDDVWFAAAEAFDGLFGGLVGVVGGVPEADEDAVVGKMRADALADGPGL
jgi:hypothetical protein